MININDKKIFFSGIGEYVPKDDLITYLIQKGGSIVKTIEEANLLIEGNRTTPDISDKLYNAKKEGKELIEIQVLEKEFSDNFKVNNTIMAIKLTKDMDRLLKLLKNKYFNNDTFVQLLKFYDWKQTVLYEDDMSRDICTVITKRFCSLAITNHNIQHSPIGIYYTALETNHSALLEQIYLMPEFKISDRNAKEDQPLTLKEVVALNPNTSVAVQQQILQNKDPRELYFLASNHNVSKNILEQLQSINNDEITLALIKAGNYQIGNLMDEKFQKEIFVYQPFTQEIFNKICKELHDDLSWIYLSQNDSLNSSMIDMILEKNIDNATINLLKNENLSFDSAQNYLKKNDKIFNIALAHNNNLTQEQYALLYNTNDLDVLMSLANNHSVESELLTLIYEIDNRMIHECLAGNPNTPFDLLMQLMLDTSHKMIVTENLTYREKIKETIGHMQW